MLADLLSSHTSKDPGGSHYLMSYRLLFLDVLRNKVEGYIEGFGLKIDEINGGRPKGHVENSVNKLYALPHAREIDIVDHLHAHKSIINLYSTYVSCMAPPAAFGNILGGSR